MDEERSAPLMAVLNRARGEGVWHAEGRQRSGAISGGGGR
jgi:hypothetical protein